MCQLRGDKSDNLENAHKQRLLLLNSFFFFAPPTPNTPSTTPSTPLTHRHGQFGHQFCLWALKDFFYFRFFFGFSVDVAAVTVDG